MFVARERELEKLNKMYNSGQYEMAIIYGRRRVGKTTLIKEFCKDKNAIYFIARESNDLYNLESFSKDLLSGTTDGINKESVFKNWDDLLSYIYNIVKEQRMIIVIDEYPYLAQANKSISSIIQAHIDSKLKDSKLFLILCGSSMSFMEEQVLGYKSPLYGRRTAQFKVKPFDFFEFIKYHKNFSNEEKAIIYGITGGIPEYLSKIDEGISLRENIIEMFLREDGHLYEEPASLLKQELREPATYNAIITSIANGASKLNQIATKAGIESNKCAKYLKSLISIGIVRREKSINEELSKKSIYVLEDNMFKFWYRFVQNNMTNIVSGNSENLYDKIIEPQINSYMGAIFEEICKDYLMYENKYGKLPIMIGKIGRWWGGNKNTKKQEEIDILAYDNENNAIFAECKWRNELVDISIINNIIKKSELFAYKNKYYYIFAKKGFTKGALNMQSDKIKLIRYQDMFSGTKGQVPCP